MIRPSLLLAFLWTASFTFSAFSHQNNPYELALHGTIPSAVIHGNVNAITGDFVINQDDYVIPAHEPLAIKRSYSTSRAKNIFAGWHYGADHLIAWWDAEAGVLVPEKSGVFIAYELDRESGSFKLTDMPGGLTNCYTGEMSARLDPAQNNIKIKKGGFDKIQAILVKGPDGSERFYRERNNYEFDAEGKRKENPAFTIPLFLEWEVLPNTNKIHYKWEKFNKLFQPTEIRATNHQGNIEFAKMVFHYDVPDKKHINGFKIQTSSCREINYQLNSHAKYACDCTGCFEGYNNHSSKRSWVLTHVSLPEKPNEDYSQAWKSPRGGYFVGKVLFPEGCYLQLYQYADGLYKEFSLRIKPNKSHPLYGKVYKLTESYHPHDNIKCRLHYQLGEYDKRGGSTTVYDAQNNLTVYRYNKHFLLTDIEHYDQEQLFSKEQLKWSEPKAGKINRLLSKTVSDSQGASLMTFTLHYDSHGNVSQEDLEGSLTGKTSGTETHSITRTYQDNHLLQSETHPSGKVISTTYQGNTNLISARYIRQLNGPQQQRHFFFYDNTILIKEIQDNGTGQSPEDLSGVTQRIIKTLTPVANKPFIGLPEIITEEYLDPTTHETHLLSKRKISYNLHGHIASVEHFDANGISRYTLTYDYDAKGRLIRKTDPLGHPHEYGYDENHNLTYENASNQDFSLSYNYDLTNYPTTSTQTTSLGEKRIFQSVYNTLHQEIQEIDSYGNITENAYSAFGHLLKKTGPPIATEIEEPRHVISTYQYNALGHRIESTDPEGNTTYTTCNIHGNPTRILHPDESEEFYTYTLSGLLETHLSAEKVLTSYTYDFLDRITSKVITSATGELLDKETYIYNAYHLVEKQTFDGTYTLYSYDGAGRKIREETLGENVHRETIYTYDEFGRLFRTIHPIDNNLTQILETHYDLLDRITEEIELDQDGNIHSYARYTYDDFDHPITHTKEVQAGDAVTITKYDAFDRIISETNPLGHTTTFDYDDSYQNTLGQTVLKKTTTDPNGTQTIEVFDAYDHLSSLEIVNPQRQVLLREELYYNLNGQPLKQISTLIPSKHTITKIWDYDSRGRLIILRESPDTPHEKTTHYSYTLDGHLKQLTKPSNLKITYSHDSLGRITTIKTSDDSCHYELSYDDMGYITHAKNCLTNQVTTRTYDHFGNLLTETTEHGLTTERTYDNLGRKLSLTLPDHSSIHYTYDAYHLTKVTRYSSSGKPLYSHTYDAYDKSHNLLAETLPHTLGTTTYQIDLLSRPIQKHNSFQIEDLHTFDSNGNLLAYSRESSLPNEEHQYTYDGLDRLITLQTPTKTHHFHYDFFNRLLSQTTDNLAQENYLYDGQNELGNYPQELRILGQGKGAEIGATLAIEAQSKLYIPLHDLFGNIIALVDPYTNQTIESYRYSAFGEEKLFNSSSRPTSTALIPWRFQSKRKIDTLIFYGRRFYDPEHGRWLSPDPKGFDEGPNLYQFNRNNPFVYLDLYGEEVSFCFQDFLNAGLFGILGIQEEYAQDFKTALVHGATASLASMLDVANAISPAWDLKYHPSYADRADLWYRESFPANTETPLYQAGYWTGVIGMDILACRGGTTAIELVTNSWKSASRFSETHKALDLIERYEQPVYRSGFSIGKGNSSQLLIEAASEGFKETSLTKAGRALTKHPGIIGLDKSTLRINLRSDSSINDAAVSFLKDLVKNGKKTVRSHDRYSQIIEIRNASGKGARWYGPNTSKHGEFIGFVD
ncbi:RHS repeat-associated core domain-containing protein [Simkania sp.]|uniref:RHS repeat-associated core domain-containing protein n=1 Tax=Simkania sp. TaxID=34094 RepID=UPI003B5183E8